MRLNSKSDTLYRSSNANFTMGVATYFGSFNEYDNKFESNVRTVSVEKDATNTFKNVYVDARTYLTLGYFLQGNKAANIKQEVYQVSLGDAQMYEVKELFKYVRSGLLNKNGVSAFVDTEQGLALSADFSRAFNIENIGADGHWISVTVDPAGITLQDSNKTIPAIIIRTSKAPQNAASILTVQEFVTVATIIESINLVEIRVNATNLATAVDIQHFSRGGGQSNNSNYNRGNANGGYNRGGNAQGNNQPQAAPQYTPNANRSFPQYGANANNQQAAPVQQAAPTNQPPVQQAPQPQTAPIEEVSYDDDAAMAGILDGVE